MNIGRLSSCLLCFALFGCARHEGPSGLVREPATAVAKPPPAPVAPSPSGAATIYDLEVPLRDETGVVRPLDSFRGHPVLITMFYGSCPVACPILTSDLKRIERQIPEALRSDLRILMVSFDPDRDTPVALANLKRERGLDPRRWTLASTADDQARELAGVLDIKYRKVDGGAFFHTSVIVLLDREGRPQARLEGAGSDISGMLSALGRPSI